MGLVSDEINLLHYWRVVTRRRWTVYLAVAAVGLVALIGSITATPLYRATTTLQIERRTPDILTFQDLSQLDFSFAAYSDFFQTQYKIIASEPVARRAVERLGLADHPDFQGETKRPGLMTRIRGLIPRRRADTESDPVETATAQVLGGLQVSPIRNSQLVNITWISSDPDLASSVANAVAESYIHSSLESQFSASGQAEEFLVNQIGTLKQEISVIEAQRQDYGESKSIVSIDESSNLTLQALEDISEQRTAAQTALASAKAAYESVVNAPPEALPQVMNSPLISRLREEYATLESEISEKSRRFGSDWPNLQTLTSRLDQARVRLAEETEYIAQQVRTAAEAEYDAASREVGHLEDLLLEQEEAAQRLKRDAVEFANLQSEVLMKRETLDALMSRQNEMALSTRLQDLDISSSNIRFVVRASPPKAPFRPNTKANVLLGLVFGLLLGVTLAILLDHIDNTVGSVDELQTVTGRPALAVIPRHGSGGSPLARVRRKQPPRSDETLDLVAHLDAKAGAAEAYRDLRTALLLSNPGQPPRSILVTSATPEEGKTATAINLAVVLAQLGSRVLLVDTDLRRPRLHKAFGVENRRGVTNFLSGMNENLNELTRTSDVPNLDLLTSGPIPPNPSELLNSSTFVDLCRQLQEHGYRHVVFDSPPVLSVSDPVIIADVVDSCVLVSRAGRTPRQSIRLAVDRLLQAGNCSLGVVLNDLDPGAPGSSHYGYRYYGRYSDDDAEPPSRTRAGGATGA